MSTTAQRLLSLTQRGGSPNEIGDDGNTVFFYAPHPDFESPGFDTLQRDSSYNWVSQGRLSRDNAMQFTGPGEDVFQIEGRLFPKIFGGLDMLDRLHAFGRAGQPLLMARYYINVDPLEYIGINLGRFAMRRLRRTATKLDGNGIPNQVDFELELVLYGDDMDGNNWEFNYIVEETT